MSEQVEQVLRMVDRELTVEEVASEAMQIELRIILGTHRPADLVRREVLRASRQHIQSQLDLTRRLLSTRRGVSLVLSGPGPRGPHPEAGGCPVGGVAAHGGAGSKAARAGAARCSAKRNGPMTRELTEDEVAAEISDIEVRLIRGTSNQADLDRYSVFKASRQHLLRERSYARQALDSMDDELRGMIGDLAEVHLAEVEAALLVAPSLTEAVLANPPLNQIEP